MGLPERRRHRDGILETIKAKAQDLAHIIAQLFLFSKSVCFHGFVCEHTVFILPFVCF